MAVEIVIPVVEEDAHADEHTNEQNRDYNTFTWHGVKHLP